MKIGEQQFDKIKKQNGTITDIPRTKRNNFKEEGRKDVRDDDLQMRATGRQYSIVMTKFQDL